MRLFILIFVTIPFILFGQWTSNYTSSTGGGHSKITGDPDSVLIGVATRLNSNFGINDSPQSVFQLSDNSVHANTAYAKFYQINDAAGIMGFGFRSPATAKTLGKAAISGTRDGGSLNFNVDATGSSPAIYFKEDNVAKFVFHGSGDIGLGTTSKPSSGGGKVLLFGDNTTDPTLPSNTSSIYGKDDAGNVHVYVRGEGAAGAKISPHRFINGGWEWVSETFVEEGGVKITKVFRMEKMMHKLLEILKQQGNAEEYYHEEYELIDPPKELPIRKNPQ